VIAGSSAPALVTAAVVHGTGGRAPSAEAEFSADGLSYDPAGTFRTRGRVATLTAKGTARYVALRIGGRAGKDARVVAFSVLPAEGPSDK
ncbi:hypothetical protein AB0R12_29205, partial [Streptomyces niveus]|uniref:hypothetical protein n=1 Tax=Streptomyces niveus TaxID=193462 RepID=UPI00341E21D6